jgi:hypothetical protein
MAHRTWVTRPGGRVTRFRNRQARCDCRGRRHGRPALGRGLCHDGPRPARVARREAKADVRRAWQGGCAIPERERD